MKTIKVSEATNTQLDWLVAKCWYTDRRVELGVLGHLPFAIERAPGAGDRYTGWMAFSPTTTPAQMWPIIHREVISIHSPSGEPCSAWVATRGRTHQWGADGLIAAARCYVVSKLGEEVEVPDELA